MGGVGAHHRDNHSHLVLNPEEESGEVVADRPGRLGLHCADHSLVADLGGFVGEGVESQGDLERVPVADQNKVVGGGFVDQALRPVDDCLLAVLVELAHDVDGVELETVVHLVEVQVELQVLTVGDREERCQVQVGGLHCPGHYLQLQIRAGSRDLVVLDVVVAVQIV